MFHDGEPADRDPQGRLYAKLDHRAAADGKVTFWFDCIDASWFDRFADGDGPLPILKAPLAILSIAVTRTSGLFNALAASRWLQVEFGVGALDVSADQYLSFVTPPVPTPVKRITQLTQERAARLNATLTLNHYPDATLPELDRALGRTAPPQWVAAFDVGQGSANALIGPHGAPVLYYDFGGGIMVNEATFPSHLQRFCFSSRPPVVLSHWDWDHWSSAARDLSVLDQPWIVPRQPIDRPVHLQLAADLHQRNNLLIWPPSLPSRSFGAFELELCTGSTRNDTGLALWFTTQNNELALLSGDARYGAVPSLPHRSPNAIVVPHHGAKCAKTKVPPPPGTSSDRLVVSVGDGNSHGHPTQQCTDAHGAAGWATAVRTAQCAVGARGGVRVIGDAGVHAGAFPCHGSHCDLAVNKL
jgi:beta-lactamase superfamily II metal-dependent hydrolase